MDDFIVAAAMIYEDERSQRSEFRNLRDHSNPFELRPTSFKKLFRLPQPIVLDLIKKLNTNGDLDLGPIPGYLKVLCALSLYGHGSYQTHVGHHHLIGQSQPSVSRSLDYVTDLIIKKIMPQTIVFPTSDGKIEENIRGFQDKYGIAAVGVIDGTHIAITTPAKEHPTAPAILFFNRKGYYSINCQIICDADKKIISVKADFPGSTHDAAILRASNINRFMENQYITGKQNRWLLGDKGYPILPWVMTPIDRPATPAEEHYNKIHKKARIIIEQTFGLLKAKFRCINKARVLHYSPTKAAKIVVACCTMYNLYIKSASGDSDSDSSSEDGEEVEVVPPPVPDGAAAATINDDEESSDFTNAARVPEGAAAATMNDDEESSDFTNAARDIRLALVRRLNEEN